jgi:hypothetical protein
MSKMSAEPWMARIGQCKVILLPATNDIHGILTSRIQDVGLIRGVAKIVSVVYSREDRVFIRHGRNLIRQMNLTLVKASGGRGD